VNLVFCYSKPQFLFIFQSDFLMSIATNLLEVRKRIAFAAMQAGRHENSVRLIAVSKMQPVSAIIEANAAGQLDFGENYVQEALDKQTQLKANSLCWHFIGPIQSNKTRAIAENFDWVHSVGRVKVAERLSSQRPRELGALKILLQVNLSGEESKSGISLAELPILVEAVYRLEGLNCAGLMVIPAPISDPVEQLVRFKQLSDAASELRQLGYHDMKELSMGMSSDFPAAIAAGATQVRIGTEIFGVRQRLS
jgi:pyridoxal phosphate enzyme (YggS family)